MTRFLLLFLLFCVQLTAQIPQPKPAAKDPFFSQTPTPATDPGQKVKHIHSDRFGKDPSKYDGNIYFDGNVQFEHQGSYLNADLVILYEAQNFVRAIGNVRLQNPDGSVITANEMEYDGNSERGIARKNVLLQDPAQTIKTELLYYDRRQNLAYFNTGGTITRQGSTMYTRSATYDIASRMIDFTGNVKIENADYIVDGTNIKQNQNTNTAEFFGPTTITSRSNPKNYVYTEQGRYLMNQKEVLLNKNSRIHYNDKILTGEKMYYNQITGFGRAEGKVLLRDPLQKRYLVGDYGEIYEHKDSAMVRGNAYAVKILEKDSMYFSANKIITYQRADSTAIKKSFLQAYNRSRFYKSNAQARADSITFNETDGILHLFDNPVLWSGERQVTGDKIEAYFDTQNEFIDSLKVINNAMAISKVDSLNLKDEFNQVKGKLMTVYYEQNEVKLAKVIGNAEAITYADDEDSKTGKNERIGVALSSCGIIEAMFEGRQVQIISCNIGARTNIHPMSKISDEQRFLRNFNWNTKDRIRKWQDILVDTPNYEEIKYTSDNPLYEAAQAEAHNARAAQHAANPNRTRR